jgi:hypothetical protein
VKQTSMNVLPTLVKMEPPVSMLSTASLALVLLATLAHFAKPTSTNALPILAKALVCATMPPIFIRVLAILATLAPSAKPISMNVLPILVVMGLLVLILSMRSLVLA